MTTVHMRALTGLAAAVVLTTAGCQYHWGPVAHPQIRSLAVGTFANASRESTATATLRGRLAEAVSKEPGLTLAEPSAADAILEGRVLKVSRRQLARAKVREEGDSVDESDVYQTVLYRLEVEVEYSVRLPGKTKPFIETRQVIGQTQLGNWPDQQIVQANALRAALGDAANQIVAAVTESW